MSTQKVRALVDAMHETEPRLLAAQRAEAAVQLRLSSTAWWISSAAGLALLALYFLLQRRSFEAGLRFAETLSESEERFRTFVDNSPMLAFIADNKGELRWANKTFKDQAGPDPGRLLALADEKDKPAPLSAAREYMTELPDLAGGMRSWFVLRFSLELQGETLIGVSALEVTQQREAEQKLEAYTKELERSNRELQDFASVAAHDLQEPLRKIRAFGDLLEAETEGALGPDSRDYVLRMQSSAMRMQALIEDLLSFSRVNTRAVAMAPVDLGATLAEVLSDLELALAQGGMSVESEALPVVEADSTQMRQLFQNLVANAIKFRRKDTRPLLHIGCRAQAAAFELEFRDNGIGFDKRYADKIFTIFQRLHGRDEYEGNGVGLAVCRRIAERHGGSIRAESEPGKGSAFVVRLPLKQAKRKVPA